MRNNVYIYSLLDENNQIRYIGKTNDIKKRLRDHITESKIGKRTYKNNWINSMLKNNSLPIIEIIDEVPIDEWRFWEQFYISLFKTWGFKLTNSTVGGDGTGHGIFNPNFGKTLTEEHKKKCSLKLSGENNPFFGKTHSIDVMEKINKRILQYTLDGNFIKEWKSIKEAESTLNIHSISSCCNKKLLSAGGFIWIFKSNDYIEENIVINKKYRKIVYQFNINGELIKEWKSVRQAEKTLKIGHISKVCNNIGSHKSSGGYIWKYKNT